MSMRQEPLEILYRASKQELIAEKLIVTFKDIVDIDTSKDILPKLEVERTKCDTTNDIDIMNISTKLNDITQNVLENTFVLDQMLEEYIFRIAANERVKIFGVSEPRLLFKTINDINNKMRITYQELRELSSDRPWLNVNSSFLIKSTLRSMGGIKMVVFIGYEELK